MEYANKMEQKYPDRYAGAAIADDNGNVWIAFRGGIPDEAVNKAKKLPFKIKLVANQGYSEEELTKELNKIHSQIYECDDIADVQSHYDIESGNITVETEPADSISMSERRNLRNEL